MRMPPPRLCSYHQWQHKGWELHETEGEGVALGPKETGTLERPDRENREDGDHCATELPQEGVDDWVGTRREVAWTSRTIWTHDANIADDDAPSTASVDEETTSTHLMAVSGDR